MLNKRIERILFGKNKTCILTLNYLTKYRYSDFSKSKEFDNKNKDKTSMNNKLLNQLFEHNVKQNKIPSFKFHTSQLEIINQPSEFYLSLIVS